MIVRIFRGWMEPDEEDGVYADFRTGLASGSRPAGLMDLIFARNVGADGRVELVTITLWTDRDAIVAGLGPDWQRPMGLQGFEGRLTDTALEHLEVVADDWPELLTLLQGAPKTGLS